MPQHPRLDNPFAPPPREAEDFNPFARPTDTADAAFADDDEYAVPEFNPFAPAPTTDPDAVQHDAPGKLRLLDRGRRVFGSYAKVLLWQGDPAAYAQFGPISAYPRAQQIRSLYPRLPSAPLPAVITCIAATPSARGHGLARRLVDAVVEDLAARGFAAIEAYPDLALPLNESAAADPTFWAGCGFEMGIDDERYPVMRRDLG